MASNVTFQDRGTHMRCQYSGRFELGSLIELMREIRAHVDAHRQRRLLVDLRDSPGTLNTLERYEHAVAMAREPARPGLRIAVLVRPDQLYADRFWETLTRNRGRATHVSTDHAEALRWRATDDL